MSFNGSGTFNINSAGQPVVSGTVISSSVFNTLTADLATGLSTCITKDGQTTVTANIPMNSYKITGLAAGTAATDAARVGQLQAGAASVVTVAGTDTYTGTMSPSLGAYAAGNTFTFVVPNTNTTASTLNIDGLGAKALTRDGSTALVAGDLVANAEVVVVYDGTRFQVLNSNSKTNFNLSGTLTVAGNTTLSGGTANGVAYLNGSKVLTTGSALTFDGTNLGVGTTAPTSAAGYSSISLRNSTGGNVDLGIGSTIYTQILATSSLSRLIASNGAVQTFEVSGSEQMRLTSTGLGIGTSSPVGKLDVIASNAGGTTYSYFQNSGASGVSSVGLAFAQSGSIKSSIVGAVYGNDYMTFNVGSNTERMRIDSSGNLGLGVTPSAWASFYRGFDISTYSAVYGATTNNAGLINNGYFNGTNWIYKNTAAASNYSQSGGAHIWSNAPSGTAGNAITFTQAMTLDASGNLLVGTTGTTTPASGFTVIYNSGSSYINVGHATGTASGTGYAQFLYNSSLIGGVTQNGTTGVLFNITSDYRLKEFVASVTGSGERIDALNPVEFDWKSDGSRARGFFAHEFQQVYANSVSGEKDAVDEEGNPVYQTMQASTAEVIADLVAEIKSLRVRLNALENK